MQIDQATLARYFRTGMRNIRNNDVLRVIRRSKGLRRLINGPIADMGQEAGMLLDMVKDYTSGTYREAPRTTVLAGAFALLYVMNPFDLMPDFIPGIGFIDDMSMLALVVGSIRKDIEDYARWRRSRAAIARRLQRTFGIRPRRMLAD